MAKSTLEGKSVVVTGGVSGIGLALSKFHAFPHSTIHLLDIKSTPPPSLLSSLESAYPSTKFVFKQCDISSWEQQAKVFKEIYNEVGRIDIVCANAGVSEIGNFLEREEEGEEPRRPGGKTLDVNLTGTLFSIKLGVFYMRKNSGEKKGSIICTASNAGLYPFPIAPMYGTSKHAVVGAVRSLALPLQADGIRINAICPNCIATGLADDNLFASMIITPMETLLKAAEEIGLNEEMTGQALEVSGEKFTIRQPLDFVDDITKKNFDSFWELGYA